MTYKKGYKRECPEKSILLGGSRLVVALSKYFTLLHFTYLHQKSNGTLRIQQLQTTSKMEWNGVEWNGMEFSSIWSAVMNGDFYKSFFSTNLDF